MRRLTLSARLRALRLARRRRLRVIARYPGKANRAFSPRVPDPGRRAIVDRQLFASSAHGVDEVALLPSTYRDRNGRYWRCLRLAAPKDFRFHVNPDEILEFIYELRRQVFIRDRFRARGRKRRPGLYIDLDGVKHIDLEGALILTAEIDRIRLIYRTKPHMDDANWDRGVRATLHGLGLYQVVEAQRAADAPPMDDISQILSEQGLTIVPFLSCHAADSTKALELRRELWEHCAASDEAKYGVYDCLVEAFSNAVQHAYRQDISGDGLPSVRRWWAGGLVDKKSGHLLLVVYDQGVGIPKTLVKRPWWHVIAGRLREQDDASIIEGALEYGRSGTAKAMPVADDADGRGNGLWRMCELTDAFEQADVQFTSLKGQVLYAKGGTPERVTLPTRFCGTMIRWRAKIGSVQELTL